ncbi:MULTISPECIES: malonate decarboxylase acyl carrier protein [Methylobacterium]|uniref:Malonate decarboxylase acyl carrier protein n=1 Tax=Methylobacterium jeotgali TaxID=381630 RepID=A0ABQ4SX44_9HYPH|nr:MULTISPECIES: malonate decarboxylase acyl carrier protein [Methylobacterium]PIU06744.1 MAG: malonate decarboxylase acyl carrier protein [Methylobacterium sp. CG09_land_8_20_14_0_10_71_15]PIU14848.1 MAG: malonate decarboxylase acyl carrier protein [Methylobacterium sp. CG08_land_8_20_14_0_20_71_15]GBU17998.1 malonate decarboxylase subunit delta [Methylobacterium sp.]GJE07432.1 Malonate decarboxylase acyl carrier protein [Methylobacterium jeotgali]
MDRLSFRHATRRPHPGTRAEAIAGVVASGNLEILLERVLAPDLCTVEIETPVTGYGDVWEAVVADFVARAQPGGLRISINDGGARPDTVSLRLLQGARLMEEAP